TGDTKPETESQPLSILHSVVHFRFPVFGLRFSSFLGIDEKSTIPGREGGQGVKVPTRYPQNWETTRRAPVPAGRLSSETATSSLAGRRPLLSRADRCSCSTGPRRRLRRRASPSGARQADGAPPLRSTRSPRKSAVASSAAD